MLDALAGDARAYSSLLAELSRNLRAYYARRLGSAAEDCEDLVQDTLIAMHRRRASYDPNQPLTAWVYAIARYRLIDHYRRSRLRQTVPLEDAGALFAADEAEPAMAKRDVAHLLNALPTARAALIRKTKIEGMTAAEAGESVGLSEGAVKVNVHRGLKSLAAKVQAQATTGETANTADLGDKTP